MRVGLTEPSIALNSLFCADVPLSNYSAVECWKAHFCWIWY